MILEGLIKAHPIVCGTGSGRFYPIVSSLWTQTTINQYLEGKFVLTVNNAKASVDPRSKDLGFTPKIGATGFEPATS